ncbi:MAG: beta-ketoacyl-[acyl-carrier-protein] synthase family protein [Planctomycetes bacterium]|nr:beta-ketoacyl-[acyl-carrier-protein] synthase family protein [Planctomycetota bacterium]
MKLEPIYITGVGAVTPLGGSYQTITERLLAGVSGVRSITEFPVADHLAQIGATVTEFPCPDVWDADQLAELPRVDQVTLVSCTQALQDAGWWGRRSDARVGIVLGSAAAWESLWENDALTGGQQIYQTQSHVEPLVHRTRQHLALTGPAVSMSAACASGNYAIALARRWLQMGWVDVCLAGACDMAITPMTLAGFGNLRALSRRNDDPQAASRPFDADRDGFVMGEGGAMFVLERAAQARQRGTRVYAEVAGCGASSDAYHMVIPSPHPEPAIAAMRQALTDARCDPSDVDYVNAHATSTPVGDSAEAKVLQSVFGSHIENLPVSSTKSMTGHLLTAAAAVEALACVIALDRQTVPPTINLRNPDPECPLRHVPNHAEHHRVRVTASNSFGFGGSNTCLILKAA